MNAHAELNSYLANERAKVEQWRGSPPIVTENSLAAALEMREFTTSASPPVEPNKAAAKQSFWNQTHTKVNRDEPKNAILASVIIFVSLILAGLVFATFPLMGISGGGIAAFFTAVILIATGLFLIKMMRDKAVNARTNALVEQQFGEHWTEITNRHRYAIKEHNQFVAQEKQRWAKIEQERIGNLRKLVDGNVEAIKSKIAELVSAQSNFRLCSVWVLSNAITIVGEIPRLEDVINSKSKQISTKSGKIINKTKKLVEKEEEYARFAAGNALQTIGTTINSAPSCAKIQVALFSDRGRKAFHIAGTVLPTELETFDWRTVDPVEILEKKGFSICGGKSKKETMAPEWLTSLKSVQIDTAQ